MADSPPPPGGESPDMFPACHDDPVTNSDAENETEMEIDTSDLEQSKTCDANCCDHSCNCKCSSCFCQVRTDIQINANQTTYSGEGGNGELAAGVNYGQPTTANEVEIDPDLAIAYEEFSLHTTQDSGVNVLPATMASLSTDASVSIPVAIAMQREAHSRAASSIGPPSFYGLRARHAHESLEERAHSIMQKYIASMHGGSMSEVEIEHPDEVFIFPIEQQAEADLDNECIFAMDVDSALGLDLARWNSNEVSSHAFSPTRSHTPHTLSDNVSAFLRHTGAVFGRESQYSMTMTLSEHHIEPPMGFLPLVQEFRYAAECA
jgi:hypothetical protein